MIIPRVDDLVYEKNVVDIGEEIIEDNDWINEDELENIYKLITCMAGGKHRAAQPAL